MAEVSQEFLEGLVSLKGKVVQVTTRRSKALDAEPGESSSGYYLVKFTGIVQDPPLRTWPEDNPNAVLCFWIKTTDQRQTIYAIAVDSIDEVDDEIEVQEPKPVHMTGLTVPTA